MRSGVMERSDCAQAHLVVRRQDIRWVNVTEALVQIEIRVHNTGDAPSKPTVLNLQTAGFGAFVPWRPLTTVLVPPIEPGGERRVKAYGQQPAIEPLGSPRRVKPDQLATALAADDEHPQPRTFAPLDWTALTADDDSHRPVRSVAFASTTTRSAGMRKAVVQLAPDLYELHGRANPHWAGNLNVHIGTHSVERHLSGPLRLYPGRLNLGMFCVGLEPNAYMFELDGEQLLTHARLCNFWQQVRTIDRQTDDGVIVPGRWIDTPHTMLVMLMIDVPQSCRSAQLAVHVTQRSSGKDAVVEFSLDAAAQGSGCYVV